MDKKIKKNNPLKKDAGPLSPDAGLSEIQAENKAVMEDGCHLPAAGEVGRSAVNKNYFLLFLLLIVFIGCYHIIKPYLNTIILAAILAIIFSPIHSKIEKKLSGWENTAAFFSCILITLVVVLPLVFMLTALIGQGISSFNAIYDWVEAGKYQKLMEHPFITGLLARVDRWLPDVQKYFPNMQLENIQIDKMVLNSTASIGKILIDQGGNLAGNLTALVGKFFMMLFTFFFFIRDEKKITNTVFHLIPLSASQEEKILLKIKTVSKSVLLGTLVTALAQGAAGGIAFWIAGLPGFFWGMMMAFASLIPMVGTALIWIPAAVFLFVSGHWGYGIFMVLWCIIVVGMIDNLIRPLFMQGAADMSTLLIFFAILGGLNYFGLIGLLYGPLIFGLAMVLLYIYKLEFEAFLDRQDRT
ncbi:MAG: AI-2E family transporter [Deltaproteobacteria bacterium]|nr:AI-2E family transporter [Deltaproteobacteria bacterium]